MSEQSLSDETIAVSFLGVDKRSMSAYEFFFNGMKQIPCELVDDISQAQLCLVDKDAYNIQEKYKKLRQEYPDKLILFLSLEEPSCLDDKEFFLQKPVKKNALQASLTQIYHLLSGKTVNTTPINSTEEKTDTLNNNDKFSQKVDIHSENNQPQIAAINNQIKDNTIVSIKTPAKEKPKTLTAKAGQLLKVVNEKDFVGQQADIDINDPAQLEKIFYEPNKFLQAIVEKVCIKSRQAEAIIQLNVLNHVFYFDYQEQKVYSTVGPGIIRPLCLLPHDHHISYKIKDPAFRAQLHEIIQANKNKTIKKNRENQSWNMEAFMWLITLWCSRGRLPKGTSLSNPVYLMQWPNLTRLDPVPHAVHISALLYKQPHTLLEITQQLGIEQRYVFAFYSACKSVGLAHVSRREVDKIFVPEKAARHKNKSILSKLLSKLAGFKDKSEMNEIA
ncbi:MAG: hypothetical protein KAI22_10580 [Gammaproteobacteria bacterium]|nr:hypothetical protein [Gammaproteobacteria bacterium]